jgi:hypothetical protein
MLHAMAAPANTMLSSMSSTAITAVLANERDPHRLQRELVRASLFRCPGKS